MPNQPKSCHYEYCEYCAAGFPTASILAYHEAHNCRQAASARLAAEEEALVQTIADTFPEGTSPALAQKIAEYLAALGVTSPLY